MTALFLVAFILGLVVAVRIMLFGIEHGTTPGTRSEPGRRPRYGMTAAAAALLVFGIVGYALARTSATNDESLLAIAGGFGILAGALAAWGSARWAAMPVEHDIDDPRYVLQGHVAEVTKSIRADQDGEIRFEFESQQRVVRARTRDGLAVDAGTEVVIEAVEDDVAYVEPWHIVEQRL